MLVNMFSELRFFYVTFLFTSSLVSVYGQQKMYHHKNPKQDKDDKEVFHLTRNTELAYAGVHTYCQIEYLNHNDLAAQVRKDAELKMLSAEAVEKQINELPAALITMVIKRSQIDEANLKRFSIVIQSKEGKELFRSEFNGGKVPEYIGPSTLPGYFMNVGSVRLDQEFKEEVKVFVIDDYKSIRHEFLIRPE